MNILGNNKNDNTDNNDCSVYTIRVPLARANFLTII